MQDNEVTATKLLAVPNLESDDRIRLGATVTHKTLWSVFDTCTKLLPSAKHYSSFPWFNEAVVFTQTVEQAHIEYHSNPVTLKKMFINYSIFKHLQMYHNLIKT